MKMQPITEQEFSDFRKLSIQNYAEGISLNSGFPLETVLPSAETSFDQGITNGVNTPDNYFYYLKTTANENAGYIWFGVRGPAYNKRIFICDIYLYEKYRGQGHGKFMLTWLDEKAKALGYSEIALHAFTYNTTAIGLYETMGYQLTNVHLAKKL